MADHSTLQTTENYATLLGARISGRMDDQAKGFDPAFSTPTNIKTDTIRWSSAASKWQKWNGTAWIDLSTTYSISISGNAATANTATSATTAATVSNYTGSSTGTSSALGTINLSNPNGSERSLTQNNGTTNTGFTLGSLAFKSALYDTPRANTNILQYGDGMVLNYGTAGAGVLLDETNARVVYRWGNIEAKVLRFANAFYESDILPAGYTNQVKIIDLKSSTASNQVVRSTWIRNSEDKIVSVVDDVLRTDGSTAIVFYTTPAGSRTTQRVVAPLILEGGYTGSSAGGRVICAGANDDGVTNLQAGSAKFSSLSLTQQPYFYGFSSSPVYTISSGTTSSSLGLSSGSGTGVTLSSNVMVFSTAGLYEINLSSDILIGNTSGSMTVETYCQINGGAFSYIGINNSALPNSSFTLPGTRVLTLAAGDTVSIGFKSSGSWGSGSISSSSRSLLIKKIG